MMYHELIKQRAEDFVEEREEELEAEEDLLDCDLIEEWIWEDWDAGWYGFLREDIFNDYHSELTTCAKIIELSSNPETDSGLWEGQEPKKAIETQAYFSALNDFREAIREVVEEREELDA